MQRHAPAPIRLEPLFRERVWGRESLAPFFPLQPSYRRIGEVWFTFEENPTAKGLPLRELLLANPTILGDAGNPKHPGICPILVKFLFTSERLSVQVHPDDAYAEQHHGSLGKTEAWHVLAAEEPAEIAVGFRETLTAAKLRQAAQSGEIELLLNWQRVHAGDTIFVPAGTVHAIGAGLSICEIQENSDITYRLYDYGRPRELHLEPGVAVSRLLPPESSVPPVRISPWRWQLLACPYFRIEKLQPQSALHFSAGARVYRILICTRGTGTIAGEPFHAGSAWLIPAQNAEFTLNGADSDWILTYTGDPPTIAEA
jgi:mannose-6-phosphate isomerase